jgi:hypothetical protein
MESGRFSRAILNNSFLWSWEKRRLPYAVGLFYFFPLKNYKSYV